VPLGLAALGLAALGLGALSLAASELAEQPLDALAVFGLRGGGGLQHRGGRVTVGGVGEGGGAPSLHLLGACAVHVV